VTVRILACGLLTLSLTSELGAQVGAQDVNKQAPVMQVAEETRRQMEALERNLRGAIDSAAAQVNKRLSEVIPSTQFQLQFQAPTIVTNVLMPDGNALFTVLIPGIDATTLRVANMLMPNRGTRIANGGTAGAPVAETAPLPPGVKPMTDPDEEYTTYARLALIDALLDNTLQLAPDRKVIVIAGELQPQGPSPFRPRSRYLILEITGEDLIAFRTNRISRDDAKARIKESRY
jgi:hypothetical protein